MQEYTTTSKSRALLIAMVILISMLFIGVVIGIITLAGKDPETTGQIRDIFIIILAFESLLIGVALIILIIQLAIFANLIQNELKPILVSTKETVSTIRGTSKFIAKRAIVPIISLTSVAAGFSKLLGIIGFLKNRKGKE